MGHETELRKKLEETDEYKKVWKALREPSEEAKKEAKKNGYSKNIYGAVKCPQCRRIIQKRGGCIHMTCKCKHEFCYKCKVDWKTHLKSNYTCPFDRRRRLAQHEHELTCEGGQQSGRRRVKGHQG